VRGGKSIQPQTEAGFSHHLKKRTGGNKVSGKSEEGRPAKETPPHSPEQSDFVESTNAPRTTKRASDPVAPHLERETPETVTKSGRADLKRSGDGQAREDVQPLSKPARINENDAENQKLPSQFEKKTEEETRTLDDVQSLKAIPQEQSEASPDIEQPVPGAMQEFEIPRLPEDKSSFYFSAEETDRPRKSEPNEAPSEMTISIGQIQVEFVQPEPQLAPQPRPAIQRTRGFDDYARARRGVRRR
jgi:hypothetical protein